MIGEQKQKREGKVRKSMATLRLEKDLQSFESEKVEFVSLSFPQ